MVRAAEVMKLPMRGVCVSVSGTGIQAAGRLVTLTPLSQDDPSAQLLARWRGARRVPHPEARWRPEGAPSSAPVGPDAAGGAGFSGRGTAKVHARLFWAVCVCGCLRVWLFVWLSHGGSTFIVIFWVRWEWEWGCHTG
eukprot:92425-Chlamydomonas_euryale.AAC.1